MPPTEPIEPTADHSSSDRRLVALLLVVLTAAGVLWFVVLGAWWLNSDGSAYLSVGYNVIHGDGYRLIDGTPLHWWDRPVYPLALTAPWLVHESLAASIWVSRLPLVLLAPLGGLLTLRLTRSWTAAVAAGVAAVAQPWTLVSGGSYFVPDGWVCATTVMALVAAVLATTGPRTSRPWVVVACLATVVSILTKETGALAIPLCVAAVVLIRTHLPRWVSGLVVVATVPATYYATVLTAGATGPSFLDAAVAAPDRVQHQAVVDSPLFIAFAALTVVIILWSAPRVDRPLELTGLLLCASGSGLAIYSASAGLATRNAALLPSGIAFLVGALVARGLARRPSPARAPRLRWAAGAVGVVAALAMVVTTAASGAVSAGSRRPADQQGWQIQASHDVADWLSEHAEGRTVGCTLQYCSFYWLASHAKVDLELIPQYAAPPGSSDNRLYWSERSGFRGRTHGAPGCKGRALVMTRSDERFGSIFECDLLNFVRTRHPAYIVATGWATLTFDAGGLIPYLEVSPAFRRVYLQQPAHGNWWQAMAVYEVVDDDPQRVPDAPTFYSDTAWQTLGGALTPRDRLLDRTCFARMMRQILRSSSDLSSWSDLPACAREAPAPGTTVRDRVASG
jgi:hypothetical protein